MPAAPAPVRGGPCLSIPGTWTGFEAQEYGPGAFTSVMIRGGGWTLGRGQFSPDNSTATIVFDTGIALSGTVTDSCTTISWNNTSTWRQQSGIDVVHLISMNHLDVGYNGIPNTGFINNILNIYFADYFPRAIAIAQALRDLGGAERFIYTTHGWLAHLYLHCPANMTLAGVTLVCPAADAQQAFKDAVVRGDIAIQAAAFNSEYENAMSADMIDVHFALSRQVADEIGIPRPWVASLRDVPGTTRSLVPHLIRNNITALSVGVNGGTAPPDMPNPGVWSDPASNTSILFMQHNGGYPNNPGPSPTDPGGMSAADCVVVPQVPHVMCWAFRTDNSGPPESVDEVLGWFDIARYQFPGAVVVASNYENFTTQLMSVRSQLPVVTSDMVYYREAARAYSDCLASGQCDPADPRIVGFTRMLIKMPEHTWGLPTVNDNANWTNAQFHAALAAGEQAMLDGIASWVEQRDIVERVGFASLAGHPLAADITARMAALTPTLPSPAAAGYTSLPASQFSTIFSIATSAGALRLGFDVASGAITTLTLGGASWADSNHPLAQFHYQTLNATDFANITTCCSFGPGDQAQKIANPQHQELTAGMSQLWVNNAATPTSFLLALTLPADAVLNYGGYGIIWVNYTVSGAGAISVDMQLFNKTSTRLSEASYVGFTPAPAAGYVWSMDKLGGWVDPSDVVSGGSQHQHGVADGVIYAPTSGVGQALMVTALDTPVVSPATPLQPASIVPVPLTPLQGAVSGMHFILHQNAYNTNYLLFSIDANFRFRWTIALVAPPESLLRSWAAHAALRKVEPQLPVDA